MDIHGLMWYIILDKLLNNVFPMPIAFYVLPCGVQMGEL